MSFDSPASVCNLAKAMLMDLDRRALKTEVATPTLELLLNTIVSLAEPQQNIETRDRSAKTMMGYMAEFSEAVRGQESSG